MGQSSSIHSSPVHTPGLHCAQARREGPSPGVPSGVSSPSLTQKLKMHSLPLSLIIQTAVLNPVVQASWGPGQCAHLRPLPSSPGVGGVWRAACSDGWEQVVTRGGTEALRSSGLHPTPPRIPESPPPKSVWAGGGVGGWERGLRGPCPLPLPAPVLFPGNVMLRKGQVWAPGPAFKLNLPELLNSGEG